MSESANNEVSLAKLIEEIDQHVPRIRSRASAGGASAATSGPMLELSGTVLPILRDLASYVAMLEAAVVKHSEETSDRIEQIESGIVDFAAAQQSSGTQFEPDDADKFMDYLQAMKLMLEALRDNAAGADKKGRFQEMLTKTEDLMALVEDSTLEDGEEEEGEGASESEGDSEEGEEGTEEEEQEET